jgi:hypothetical protein
VVLFMISSVLVVLVMGVVSDKKSGVDERHVGTRLEKT